MPDRETCGRLVAARIHALAPDPARLTPSGRAALANLRRGVGKKPGSVPEIWQHTLDLTADDSGPDAGRREAAIHIALTQWAMHQRSKAIPMHDPKRSFGQALRLLAEAQSPGSPQDSAAYRRMTALAASRSLMSVAAHARGLIGQLATLNIAFDYGRWADDLFWLQVPGQLASVQQRWGRDFFRSTSLSDNSDSPTVTSEGALA